MFPVIHSLRVRPCRIPSVTSGQARSRCLRWTAVRMKRPATSLASFGTAMLFSGLTICTGRGGAPEGVSGFAVFVPKWTIVKATIPATRTSAENHGKSRLIRRDIFRAAGVVLIAPGLDAISSDWLAELEDRGLTPDAPNLVERFAHLGHRHAGASGLYDRRHQIHVLAWRSPLQPCDRRFVCGRVAPTP